MTIDRPGDTRSGAPGGTGAGPEDPGPAPAPGPGGLSLWKAVVLGIACAFLGGALVWAWTRPDEPGAATVDVGFYQDMITHHEQAVQMALLELDNGSDPTVRSFAEEILNFQSYEIGRMDQSLRGWGYRREQRPDVAMAWMGMPVPVATMPGLATDEQMAGLRDARGAEADALFLELMAEHHRGGIHMAEFASRQADDPGVRTLSGWMAYNQTVEINEFIAAAGRAGLDVDIRPWEPAPAAPEPGTY
jgi:uncharacterized protein (DUF305 family)